MSKRLTKTIWYGSDVDSNGNPILPSTHGGLDGLNYGELFLHLSSGKATLWTLSSDGKIVEITGGGSDVDMSSYLLKSIWDKVFEIRTDSQGIEYIFGKLPVVTQYGITMYSGDGVDIPSLASGLPFDGRTIWYNPDTNQIEVIGGTGGGGTADSVAWANITGKPTFASVATSGKYDDLVGKPTLLSSFTDDVVSGKYLHLSGGTINGDLFVANSYGGIVFTNTNLNSNAFLFYNGNSDWYVTNKDCGASYKIWHSGIFEPYNYLPKSGGVLQQENSDTPLHIKGNTDSAWIGYLTSTNTLLGYIGVKNDYQPYFYANNTSSKIWHSGNDGSGSGLDADLLDGKHLSDILASNVASATKLQTARTIWGQSFDGTGDVSGSLIDVTGITFKNDYYGLIIDEFGNFSFKKPSSTAAADWSFKDSSGNKLMIINNSGKIVFRTYRNSTIVDHFVLQQGSTALYDNLTINGYVKANYYDVSTTRQASLSNSYTLGCGMYGSSIQHSVSDGYTLPALMWSAKSPNGNSSQFSIMSYHPSGETGYLIIGVAKNGTRTAFIEVQGDGVIQAGGDFLASGGITMYSDERKKTILNHVELSLKQIANAPLIEHYYNSDEKKTTHVGSIAQYWASMNDWFCKEDSEGFLTMEIQNAALASAISIARELDRYETKTDKTIKKLKKRICELEEEVERLRAS